MPAAKRDGAPIAGHELAALFSPLADLRRVVLAVSGGPDSVALMLLARRWRGARKQGPALVAATVDHRLRPDSKREAAMVAKLARKLRLPYHLLVWSGTKPATGLQRAARDARYRLLVRLARKLGADAIVTAHTLDDQAETVLMRMARGSGLSGLAGIALETSREEIVLLRPLLAIPKARLVATLRKAGIGFADDPSNLDPRFTRVRLRRLKAALSAEGLDVRRFAALARRLARADFALEQSADELQPKIARFLPPNGEAVEFAAADLFQAPEEIVLRLLARAIDHAGDEGPVELGKLEALHSALVRAHSADGTLRRTLAGAMVSLDSARLTVARAPARRGRRPARKTRAK